MYTIDMLMTGVFVQFGEGIERGWDYTQATMGLQTNITFHVEHKIHIPNPIG